MKQILLSLLFVLLLFQSGCAIPPSIDEQEQHQQQADQTIKKTDAFARGLPQ